MESEFPLVKLVEVLKHRKDFITIDDFALYKRCTAKLHAKGIVLRDEIEGSRLKTKKQQLCKAGDFLVAEIDAKVGGFGIVSQELEDAIVSSHYFLFEINKEKMERGYLNFFIKTRNFQRQIQARGSTNYAAIRPKHVLDLEISLPSLKEQKRIVAKIESMMARIEEARRLRGKAMEEAEKAFKSELNKTFGLLFQKTENENIAGFGFITRGKGPIYLEGSACRIINQKCIRWGVIDLKYSKEVDPNWFDNLSSKYLAAKGDVLVNSTGEGTIGRATVVDSEAFGLPFDSHVLAIKPDRAKVVPEYLMYFINSPLGQSKIEDSKGAKTTKQTELGVKKLGGIGIPAPSLITQHSIVTYLDSLQAKVDELKKLQIETEKELEELVPSILDKAFKGEL